MKKVLVVCLSLLTSSLFAEEKTNAYTFNVKSGVSPYTGNLGLEVQKGKWSLGVGYPASVSLKHYKYENEDSLFYGVYWNNFTNNSYDDFEEGMFFDKYERESYGVGAGYMWLWESRWNFSTGLSVGEYEEEYTNAYGRLVKDGYRIDLELSVGYKF